MSTAGPVPLSRHFMALSAAISTLLKNTDWNRLMTFPKAPLRRLLPGLALTLAIGTFAGPAGAQDASQPAAEGQAAAGDSVAPEDKVYATVNGKPITEADLAVAAQDYQEQLAQMPEDIRISQLLNLVIDMRLVAAAAEEAGTDKKEAVVRRVDFLRAMTLRNEYLRDKVEEGVTDDAVKSRFDEELAKFEPGDEYHLQHILVATEEEAKAIIADLDKGGDFAAIAKEKSTDPGSGPKGGDLGFVPKGVTVPEFEQAAVALEVGKYTEAPVKSQFGWHVLRLEETRKEPPPELAAEEERIRGELVRDFVTKELASLREAADIDVVAQPAPEAAPEGEAPAAEEPAPAQP